MANICSTTYKIIGEDSIILLHILEKLNNECSIIRLYRIVQELEKNNKMPDFDCRGEVFYFECARDDNNKCLSVTMNCETCWDPLRDFRAYLRNKLDVLLFFTAEEEGCGLFCTNNPENTCRCKLSWYIQDEGEDFEYFDFGEEKNVYQEVCSLLNIEEDETPEDYFKAAQELIESFYKEREEKGIDTDEYICLNEFEYIDE